MISLSVDVPTWNRTAGLTPHISVKGPHNILHFLETSIVNPLSPHLTWGPSSPHIACNKAHLILHCALTTWARARHRVCSITQVFSATDGAAMVPLFPVRLSSLSSLGWNPPRSCCSSTPLSPGRHVAQLVERGSPRGRTGGCRWWWWWLGSVHCSEKKSKSTQEERECRWGEGVDRGRREGEREVGRK